MQTKYALAHSWLPTNDGGFLSWPDGLPSFDVSKPVKFVSDISDATLFDTIRQAQETLQKNSTSKGGWIGDLTLVRVSISEPSVQEATFGEAIMEDLPFVLAWDGYNTGWFGAPQEEGWILCGTLSEATQFESIEEVCDAIDARLDWQKEKCLPVDVPFTFKGIRTLPATYAYAEVK